MTAFYNKIALLHRTNCCLLTDVDLDESTIAFSNPFRMPQNLTFMSREKEYDEICLENIKNFIPDEQIYRISITDD
jgi:hypothetical protein